LFVFDFDNGKFSSAGFPRLLDSPGIFFSNISRIWKVLGNEFGAGKSWKLQLKVLEIPVIYL